MALLNLGEDPWLLEYESCNKLQRDIMEQLTLRQKEHRMSENFARISASIRFRLKQFSNELMLLARKLKETTSTLTSEEQERRNRQVEILESKKVHMQKLFYDDTQSRSQDRIKLFGYPTVSEWNFSDDDLITDDSSQYSISDLQDYQKQMLEEQEQGLNNLSQIISRQKNIAQTITAEVHLHNEIIDDLGDQIERTDARISEETKNVGIINRRDNTCIYWVTIILLLISIIIIVFV